jgi:LysR family nitrogen assimilation transcriptional regulator
MNLQQLKTFVLIAELGSLSKVSDRIRIAQPALSRQMKLLQEEVGVPLLARHRLGLRLTEAGEEMLRRVSGVIRQLDQAFEDVRTLPGAAGGRVAFGIVPTASYVLAGQLAYRVAARFPGISLRIVEGYSVHLIEWLQRGEIDAAIMYGSDADFHLETQPLLLDELVLVGPPDSDLKPDVPVTVAALSALPLVLPSRPNGLRLIVEGAAAKAKVKLIVRFEADSFRVLNDLVEKGLGYAVLPLSAIGREREARYLKFAPLIQPKVTRQLVLGLPPDRVASRATKVVIDLAREEIKELTHSGAWPAKLLFRTGRTSRRADQPHDNPRLLFDVRDSGAQS